MEFVEAIDVLDQSSTSHWTWDQDSDGVKICTKVRTHGLCWISKNTSSFHARRRRHADCICMDNLVYPPPRPTKLSSFLFFLFLFAHSSSVEIDRVL